MIEKGGDYDVIPTFFYLNVKVSTQTPVIPT